MIRAVVLALSLTGAAGCAILPRPIPEGTDPTCVYYDSQALAWQAVGATSAGLATVAGTAAAGVGGAGIEDADTWAIGLGTGGAVLGVLATVAGLLAGEYASRISAECGP